MAKDKVILTRKKALLLAAFLSIVLYVAGLMSGLATSKIAQEQTELDISFLTEYVDNLDEELRSVQLQESFIASLDDQERCSFADDYFYQFAEQLDFYWSVFPTRLEQYEYGRHLGPDYLLLKEEYTQLSLKAWLVARDNSESCDSAFVPILYFYNTTCPDCISQGEILDDVKMNQTNKTVLVFTIDWNQEEPAIGLVSEYYSISSVPALVVNGELLQGRIFSSEEIIVAIGVDDE